MAFAKNFLQNSNELFNEADIADGLTIVRKDHNKTTPGFIYTYHEKAESISIPRDFPGDELITLNPYDEFIIQKVDDFILSKQLKHLHDGILPRSLFVV